MTVFCCIWSGILRSVNFYNILYFQGGLTHDVWELREETSSGEGIYDKHEVTTSALLLRSIRLLSLTAFQILPSGAVTCQLS